MTITYQTFSAKHSPFFHAKINPKSECANRFCYYYLVIRHELILSYICCLHAYSCHVNLYQFSCNLVSQSLATGNDIPLTKIKYLYLLYVLLSARSQAAPRSSALRRVTASGLRQRPSSGNRQQLCQHVYQSVKSLAEQELIFMTV